MLFARIANSAKFKKNSPREDVTRIDHCLLRENKDFLVQQGFQPNGSLFFRWIIKHSSCEQILRHQKNS